MTSDGTGRAGRGEAATLRRLALPLAALAVLLGLVLAAAFLRPAAVPAGGVVALPFASVLLLLGPLAAARRVERARLGRGPLRRGRAETPGEAARLPSLILVLPAGLAAAAVAALATAPAPPTSPAVAVALLVGAFPILLVERVLAAPAALPEAPDLRRLALLATLAVTATGIAATLAAAGLPGAAIGRRLVAAVLTVAGLEAAARAIGRCFLPPGPAAAARATVGSLTARVLLATLRLDGTPAVLARSVLRDQLGLDITRSFALRYLRAAAVPLLLVLAVAAWGMSALTVVPVDARAVYFRAGAPVAVLHPGLHVTWPWPLGTTRPVEWGAVHELALGGGAPAMRRATAEDAAPVEADRLWDAPHPGELTLLVASRAAGADRELFQSVAADLRVFYRVGLDDRSAIRFATAATDPATLLRQDAGLLVTRFFAARTLPAVLGGNREEMAGALRTALARLCEASGTGLEPVAVAIEAVHPPAGAAAAYHAVRAAVITADAAIYAERGRALTIRAQTRQYAFGVTAAATALAAEGRAAAEATAIRFAADAAIAAGPDREAFLHERRLRTLQDALARKPLTLIDSRLPAAATTVDLRPPGPAAPSTGDGE